MTAQIDRSSFLRLGASAGAGLVLALHLPGAGTAAADAPFTPNAWIAIGGDDRILFTISKAEMGQGIAMGLSTMLADELDASLANVRIAFAPSAPQYCDDGLGLGPTMVTGGSTSARTRWMPMREAGATARAMLIAAAAKSWNVDPATCRTQASAVHHDPSGRRATYGSLAAVAATLPVPTTVTVKTPAQFTLIGTDAPRLDVPAKVNGRTRYGIDVRVPGMRYAAIARSPVFGGTVERLDARKAKAIPGVIDVVTISNGVAVIAKNTWTAFKGRDALQITWNEGPNAHLSSAQLFAQADALAKSRTGERVAVTRGDVTSVTGTTIHAVYHGPFLAHATMEPMNATAHVRADSCEVWAPTQVPIFAQREAAKITGLPAEKCTINPTFLGGGYGRRLEWDYTSEAVEVSKAFGGPVKVQWTREDDIQHDRYRPMSVNALSGTISGGKLAALTHTVVQKSWMKTWFPPAVANGAPDFTSAADAADIAYAVPNFRSGVIDHEHGIPVGSFRAPNANFNDFATESFIDELAHAAGADPLAFRLALLDGMSRAAGVLKLAAERAGWGTAPAHGIGRGIALVNWDKSFAATVVEISMKGAVPVVHRIVAAVDCGRNINPDIVLQQCRGAAYFGLSAAMTGKITIENGRVQQNNFYDYTVLRMAAAPRIDVHVVPSDADPSGIGELLVPPIAPAIGNAIFALTGKRVRELPFPTA